MMSADHAAENDEQVVDQRAEGGEQKEPVREEDGGDDSSDIKEDLGRQENASEMDAEVDLVGREILYVPVQELRGEDLGENCADDHHGGHHRDDDGKRFLG